VYRGHWWPVSQLLSSALSSPARCSLSQGVPFCIRRCASPLKQRDKSFWFGRSAFQPNQHTQRSCWEYWHVQGWQASYLIDNSWHQWWTTGSLAGWRQNYLASGVSMWLVAYFWEWHAHRQVKSNDSRFAREARPAVPQSRQLGSSIFEASDWAVLRDVLKYWQSPHPARRQIANEAWRRPLGQLSLLRQQVHSPIGLPLSKSDHHRAGSAGIIPQVPSPRIDNLPVQFKKRRPGQRAN